MNMLISIVVEADSPSLAAVAAIVIGCGVSYEEDSLVDAFRRVTWPPVGCTGCNVIRDWERNDWE